MDNSFKATTKFSLACSRSSPHEKQCPNWESVNNKKFVKLHKMEKLYKQINRNNF